MGKNLAPVHPGEVLLEDFLSPMGISQYRLAKDISVPPRRINEIVHGKRAISADTALRLGRFFGISPRFWLNLQASSISMSKRTAWGLGSSRKSFIVPALDPADSAIGASLSCDSSRGG